MINQPTEQLPYQTYWVHPDHLGSSSVITNSTGNATNWYEYMPFGEMLMEQTSGDYDNVYKYNGKELDESTGLYYYGARYYDPRTSIWLSVDPLAEKYPNVGAYVYTMNNPVMLIDPDGLAPTDIIIRGKNNSSVTVKTNLIDIDVNASGLGIDFGGNYTLGGNDILTTALDIAGIFDPSGVADALSAGIQWNDGDYFGSIISGLGIVEGIGDAAKLAKLPKYLKTIEKAIDGVKDAKTLKKLTPEKIKNLEEAAEKGIPKSQLGPSGKPKVHTASKSNNKQANDAARNNKKSNTAPVKHSSDKGQKTHYHSTRDGKKLKGKDNVHYENRSTKRN